LTYDIPTALRLCGIAYLVMPATVWAVLRGSHPARSLLCWCGGTGALGAGVFLIGLRGTIPDVVSIYGGALLMFFSFPARIGSLRLECGLSPGFRLTVPVATGVVAAFTAADVLVSAEARFVASCLGQVLGNCWVTAAALTAWRQYQLKSARLIAYGYGTLSAMTVAMLASVGMGGFDRFASGPALLALAYTSAALLAAIYGSLGYMGMALERSHRQELAGDRALAQASAERAAAEQHARQLRTLLDEREELLRVLAHEVRQPLNNATATLQSVVLALDRRSGGGPLPGNAGTVMERVHRAENVIGRIIATLDNTLAATALLASPDRVDRRDADVDALVALALGDIDQAQRHRVQVQRASRTRTVEMDAGLMRLALRNVLSNALAYSPPESAVVLRVSDSDEPLALVFEVEDQGSGVPPEMAPRLFARGARGPDGTGHGLGLYVTRRVMELHGGTVQLAAGSTRETVFRLTLPQGVAPPVPAPATALVTPP